MTYKRFCIADIADVYDGPHATPKKIDKGAYFLNISGLANGRLDLSKSAFISDEDFDKWTKRVIPEAGDILFSYETRLGEAAMMPDGIKGCLGRRMGLLRPKKDLIVSEYLLYAFLSPEFQEVIRSRTIHGATVERLSIKEVPQFPLDVPPLTDQRKIANILSKLDRKISLTEEQNSTLESIAQTLFKSWFVDFDPVKAKMRGEQPEGMDAATAALFPDKLVESDELGMIPEGWSESCIGSHFDVTMGQSPKGDTYNEEGEGTPFFQGRKDFGVRFPALRVYTTDPKRFAKADDTLISVRAPVGDKNMAKVDCCVGRGLAAIRHKSGCPGFTYAFISYIETSLQDSGSSGTVFSSINQKELKNVSFVAPKPEVLGAFSRQVAPINAQIRVLSDEIITLENLRNTLLPKLLSGELDLSQLETEVA